jgi:hypothetical protein
MRTNYVFLIDSDSSGHRLFLDGSGVGIFATLGAAEARAAQIARGLHSEATLRFEPDFKWTLSDLETRAAILECPHEAHRENSHVDR